MMISLSTAVRIVYLVPTVYPLLSFFIVVIIDMGILPSSENKGKVKAANRLLGINNQLVYKKPI